MKFSIEVFEHEVPALADRLIQLTGPRPWQRRFEWLAREVSDNFYMHPWLQQHCAIEIAMQSALDHWRLPNPLPFNLETPVQFELVSFIASVVRCHEQLTPKARKRLVGMLLDGLKEDTGLLALQHEFMTAVHLMSRGFDVEFHDMETGGGYDFLASQGNVEIEVECKMFSADLGRKFHMRSTAALRKLLHDGLVQAKGSLRGGVLVVLTLPARLSASIDQHRGIERTLRRGLLAGETRTVSEFCSIDVLDFDMSQSPFDERQGRLERSAVRQFVANRTGLCNCPTLVLFSPGISALIVAFKSDKPDNVLEGMRRQLREAAKKQFSGTRPAYLCAQLQDLTADQMGVMARSDSSWYGNATGLQKMTSDFLNSSSGSPIHSVVYRAHNTPTVETEELMRYNGVAYVITNGLHRFARARAYAIFGLDDQSNQRVLQD